MNKPAAAAPAVKKVLGRGLDALIEKKPRPAGLPGGESLLEASIADITRNPYQPRLEMDAPKLEELAASIRQQGVIQPLIVREKDGKYELIAGERRLRAAQLAGLHRVPIVVRTATDGKSLELALIENIQRSDLNPMEEAVAFQRLGADFALTQDEIADRVGKSRASVANTLRLLKLPPVIQEKIKTGELKEGHAKVLLSVDDPKVQMRLLKKIVTMGLSVRALEDLISQEKTRGSRVRPVQPRTENLFVTLEDRLQRKLGTLVKIHHTSSGKGRIEIEYYSNDDFERVMSLIGLGD